MDTVNTSLYILERQLQAIVASMDVTPLNWCRSSCNRVADLMRAFHSAVDSIRANPRLSGEAIQQDTLQAMDKTRRYYDALEGTFQDKYNQALKEVLPYIEPTNIQEAINYQVAATRIWARVKSELDGGQTLEDVISRSDRISIQVLREELPAYLRYINHAASSDTEQVYQGYEQLLDVRELSLMTPKEQAAHTAKLELENGKANFDTALSYARHELDSSLSQFGASRWTVIPGWAKGTSIQV